MTEERQPWQKLTLSTRQEANLYNDWGDHFRLMYMYQNGEESYTKSLKLRPNDIKALVSRSKCKRNLAKNASALKDLHECLEKDDHNAFVDEGICDNLYDLNRLEDSIVAAHNNRHKYTGHKTEVFSNLIDVLSENLQDSLGDSLSPFVMQNEQIFEIVADIMKKEKIIDLRPLWKRLRAENKCDVQSIPDVEINELSPLEKARRLRELRVFLQIYLNRSWKDVMFLKNLEIDSNFLLSFCRSSSPKLLNEICEGKASIFKFLKMLQVRSPLYNEIVRKCPNMKACEYNKQKYLYRVQYQTHRDMLTILRNSHRLKSQGKVKALARYVEKSMGDYVVLKTMRVMPWKFEFLNEVYNLLGLAYMDTIKIPVNVQKMPPKERLRTLLQIPKTKMLSRSSFHFGRKSTYTVPNAKDPVHERYKSYIERIRNRLHFVKYPIEKCYLYYEIARSHNEQTIYDECGPLARKAIEAAATCNNFLWQFLSIMEIVKARAALLKLENLQELLEETAKISKKLNNPDIESFITLVQETSANLLNKKLEEQTKALSQLKVRKSNMSMRQSSHSVVSQTNTTGTVDEDF